MWTSTNMDSITHIALGACVGQLIAGKKFGKKALLWGAVAQSLPDIDFMAGLWCDPAQDLLAHRGFTHSFLFVLLVAVGLAMAADRWHRSFGIRHWLFFFLCQLSLHVLLDSLNAYGTAWWEPFSHQRVSFHLLFVADPLFSLPLIVAAIALVFAGKGSGLASSRLILVAFIMSGLYLFSALLSKRIIDQRLQRTLEQKNIPVLSFFSTPAPLTSWFWYYAVRSGDGFYIGYSSVFDTPGPLPLTYFPRQDSLLNPVHDREDLQHLLRFSEGYFVVQQWKDSLVWSDLRFGQMRGWQDPRSRFTFYYFLGHRDQNALLIQRGRWAGWSRQNFWDYLQRVAGRQ